MSDDKRYDQKQAQEILGRAIELQNRSPEQSEVLNRQDLLQIAEESGIDKTALLKAMAEQDSSSSSGKTSMGSRIQHSEIIALAKPGSIPLNDLSMKISNLSGSEGSSESGEKLLIWNNSRLDQMQNGIRTTITVELHDDNAEVTVSEDLRNVAGGLYGGIVGGLGGGVGFGVGMGVGIGALGSALFATLFPIGVIGGSFFLARGIYKRVKKHRLSRARQLAKDISRMLE